MRSKYRVYVCPTPKCPAMGKKGGRCPNDDLEFVPIIVVKEDPEAKKREETLCKLEEMRKKNLDGTPTFDTLLSNLLKGKF